MMDTKNAPFQKERSASLSIAVDTNVSTLNRPTNQGNTAKAFVAIYPEAGNKIERFMVQGYLELADLEAAAEALIELIDRLHGDPDMEDDDPCGQMDEDGCNTLSILTCGMGPGCALSDDDCGSDDGRAI